MKTRVTTNSLTCFKDLIESGSIKPDTKWAAKTIGLMDGVTLFGHHKDGTAKISYVKKCSEIQGRKFHELDEFLVFNIARACGINLPKVKLKSTGENIYIFSRDIAECRSDPESIAFDIISSFSSKDSAYRLSSTQAAIVARKNTSNVKKRIPIDKASIAKITLAVIIFGLMDLTGDNLGLIINTKSATAELALVDFVIDHHQRILPDFAKHKNLKSLVASHYTIKSWMRFAHLDQLRLNDYIRAFDEIAQQFPDACKTMLAAAKSYKFEAWAKKSHASAMLKTWINNFEKLKTFIDTHHHKHSHQIISRAKIVP